jgi:single-stranded DNA-binding protein
MIPGKRKLSGTTWSLFGKSFAQSADRLVKGAHVFVQGELTTREYDRTINIPTGTGNSIEHTIQQLVVELRAETTHLLLCNKCQSSEKVAG